MCRGFSLNKTCRWLDLTGYRCGINMPDSWRQCIGFQNCQVYLEELKEKNKMAGTIVIEGVGQDAEIVTNAAGGKQSKSPMAMHLVDPKFLAWWARNGKVELEYTDKDDYICVDVENQSKHLCYQAIEFIATFMEVGGTQYLVYAADCLEKDALLQMSKIAQVLLYGAERYATNNWRLIPQEEHINHALIHLIAHLSGDTQDAHIEHALCRLMMAYATTTSEGFAYNKYIKKLHEER